LNNIERVFSIEPVEKRIENKCGKTERRTIKGIHE
jgi:hypothetical protein